MTRTPPGREADVTPNEEPVEQTPSVPPAGEPLVVGLHVDAEGGRSLRVTGEIDLATSPLLRDSVMEQLAQAPRRLVLDLRGVDFLGSSGLAVLVEIRTEALRRDVGLQLVTNSRAVLRALTATGLIELFDVDTVS